MSRGPIGTAHAVTSPAAGLSLSSLSSCSLDDQHEFCKLIQAADEAHQCYSNSTHEVGRLERCLEAIRVALEASEREITAMQAVAIDALAPIMGKDHLRYVVSIGAHSL